MNTKRWLLSAVAAWVLLAVYSALSDEHAKRVIADEITGVIVDAGSGKPIPNAVAAIRFERGNTGHGSPHCFRSMAVLADGQGRFKFAAWSQKNTLANGTIGEVVAYKSGYNVRSADPIYVRQSRRAFLGVRFSSDIHVPKTDVKVELQPWAGSDEGRMQQILKVAGDFTCRWQAESDDMVLLYSIQEEVRASPIANKTGGERRSTYLEWIDGVISDRK